MDPKALAILGGALALMGGMVGSAIGMAIAGSAGTATLAEDPKQFRNVLLLAAMPLTQTFYGLIVLILIVTSVLDMVVGSTWAGYAVLGIGILSALAELISAIYQGVVCASAISLLPKTKGLIFTPGLMLAVYIELIGVLGLVFPIMAFSLLKLM
ncbi:MAG: ATPase [Chloroflexi bacterium]|nr:ATPase [Chloroflexota bacterium]